VNKNEQKWTKSVKNGQNMSKMNKICQKQTKILAKGIKG
jgi:hypothetical protein